MLRLTKCFFGFHDIRFVRYAEIFKIMECSRCKKQWVQLGSSGLIRMSLEDAKKMAAEQGKEWVFDEGNSYKGNYEENYRQGCTGT